MNNNLFYCSLKFFSETMMSVDPSTMTKDEIQPLKDYISDFQSWAPISLKKSFYIKCDTKYISFLIQLTNE